MLDGFEAALAMQDPDVIARHFEALEMFLSLHDEDATGDGDDDVPF